MFVICIIDYTTTDPPPVGMQRERETGKGKRGWAICQNRTAGREDNRESAGGPGRSV